MRRRRTRSPRSASTTTTAISDTSRSPSRERVNYDHPNALDIEAFTADLTELRAGRPVAAPIYDFAVHSRSTDVRLLDAHPIVVVDGILLFVFEEICRLIDLRVFVDASDEIRTERRVTRRHRARTHDRLRPGADRTHRPADVRRVRRPVGGARHLVVDGTTSPQRSAQLILERVGVAAGAAVSRR